MKFIELPLRNAFIIEPEPFLDKRGMFARIYCKKELQSIGHSKDIVQINHSITKKKGSIRGMHYQISPFAEIKMVKALRGSVYDVIIDIREGSPTFLRWHGEILSGENMKTIYVPEGFAHGYQALTDHSEVIYMVTQFYAPDFERGIRWDDPLFAIEWPIPNPILSRKDAHYPYFQVESGRCE